MIRAGHVACMGERRVAYNVLVGKPEGKNHLEEPGIDGRIILNMDLQEVGWGVWTGLIWFRIGTVSWHM